MTCLAWEWRTHFILSRALADWHLLGHAALGPGRQTTSSPPISDTSRARLSHINEEHKRKQPTGMGSVVNWWFRA